MNATNVFLDILKSAITQTDVITRFLFDTDKVDPFAISVRNSSFHH